jgi:hypothetical protein
LGHGNAVACVLQRSRRLQDLLRFFVAERIACGDRPVPQQRLAEEVLGTMPDEESGTTVVRARLSCGCIMEKMVPNDRLVPGRDGKRALTGKYPCTTHRGGRR